MTVRGRISRHSSIASRAVSVYRSGPSHGKAHAAGVHDRGVDRKPLGDGAHAVVEHGVARDPVRPALVAQREADHLAEQGLQ
jgi:hypothetical protein